MKKGKISELISRPFIYSLLLNAGVLLVSLVLFVPFFEENDDAFLSMIAEGAFGTREVHLIYSNIILGYIYKGLYSLCGLIRWHAILQYLFLFVAFTGITYVLTQYKKGKIASVIVLLASFYELYVSLQYSKTATFVSFAGYVILFDALRRKSIADDNSGNMIYDRKVIRRMMICAYVLLFYGMLLRNPSFCLATLLMLAPGLYELLRNGYEGIVKRIVWYAKYIVPIFFTLLVISGINKLEYSNNAGWNAFMDYNDTRMDLLDYRYDLLDYVAYGNTLPGEGVSENDALCYLTWQFGDDNVLNIEAMESILGNGAKRSLGISFIKSFVKRIYDDVFCFNATVLGSVMLIAEIYLLLSKKEKKLRDTIAYVMITCDIILIFLILLYFQYSGRWSHRIVYAVLSILPSLLMYILLELEEGIKECSCKGAPKDKEKDVAYMMVMLAILSFVTVGALLGNRFEYNEAKRTEPDYKLYYSMVENDKDNLYIADTFTFQRAYKYDVFCPYKLGSLDNYVAVGSWFVNSPITKNITARYGYDNPFDAMAKAKSGNNGNSGSDKGNVRLSDNMYVEQKMLYLSEHYEEEYKANLIGEQGGISIYEIETENMNLK